MVSTDLILFSLSICPLLVEHKFGSPLSLYLGFPNRRFSTGLKLNAMVIEVTDAKSKISWQYKSY